MVIALLAAASSVHTVRWANAYAERGHTVHLISLHEPTAGLMPAVQVHRLPYSKGLGYVLNGGRLNKLVASLGADVLNAHYASGYGTLARACRAIPVVLNVWGSDVFAFPDKSVLHHWWLLRNLRSAATVVSTSKAMALRVQQLWPHAKVHEVPFGIDTRLFAPRQEHSTGTLVIGTVKTLAPTYGIDRLLRAFAYVRQMPGMPDLQLRIVGTGVQEADLKQQASDLGIAEHTRFVGAVAHAQVPQALQQMDIYVALSRAESFGVAVLEASSAGIPVVVSDAGGLPEVVQDGRTGHVIPDGDPILASEKLHHLVLHAAERTRMGQEGRRWVQDHYEWSSCVDRMLQVLQNAKKA